jgi:Autotransporter beta-domain.
VQGPASNGNAGTIGSSSSRWNGLGLFATGQAEILNRNIGAFQDGFKSNIFGLTVGADYRFSKAFVAGTAFTYANTNGDFRQGGTFSTNAYTWTFFASYLPTKRTFIQATAGTTLNNYLIARPSRIQISGGGAAVDRDGISSSNSSGNVFSWTVLTGYDYSIRPFTFGPRLGLNYARTKIHSYTEQGNTGLELAYENQFFESFQSVLGVQGAAPFSWSYGVIIPQFNADYIHEFENSQRRIDVRFAQDGRRPGLGNTGDGLTNDISSETPTRFTFQNDVPARNWFNVGTGLIAVLPNGYQPFVNFRAMVGNSQFTNYVWTFGLRIEL